MSNVSKLPGRRVFTAALAVVLITAFTAGAVQANEQPHPFKGDRTVTVMARNIYLGADLTPAFTATSELGFLLAVGGVYQQAIASNFPDRAAAIAGEIDSTQPMLVGIQEATVWSSGAAFDPAPATNVEADFVDLILDELAALGLSYERVAVAPGFDGEFPTLLGKDVRMQVSDVILARTDLKTADLKILGTHTGSYQTFLELPTVIGPIAFPRQWAAVDVKVRGLTFRFVSTHLEAFAPPIRQAQAIELLAAHAGRGVPTIYAGDFNAQPGTGDAADILLAEGLVDTWVVANPGDLGYTSGQAADLRNEVSELDHRIDLVLTEGPFTVIAAQRVGHLAADKTPSGLWPSDHAGVVTTLALFPPGRS